MIKPVAVVIGLVAVLYLGYYSYFKYGLASCNGKPIFYCLKDVKKGAKQ